MWFVGSSFTLQLSSVEQLGVSILPIAVLRGILFLRYYMRVEGREAILDLVEVVKWGVEGGLRLGISIILNNSD